MNNMYIIPANSKKSKLIFNIFNGIDLGIFLGGVTTSLLLLVLLKSNTLLATAIKLLPISLCSLLVVPIPNYHNVMGITKDIYTYFKNRRKYYWKGWCVKYEYTNNEQSSEN